MLMILICYFSLSLYLLFFHDFKYIIDPDLTSYISIAQKYLNGDYAHAINGHWSPLASWLALPLLLMKIRPIIAFALEAIITGGVTLVGINLLLSAIGIRENIKFLYVLALSPLITWYALTEGNPDLLCLCLLTFYVYVIINEKFKTVAYGGIIAGLLGAVGYLTKSYNFYFFLLHFSLVTILYWYSSPNRQQRKILFINGLSGLLVFAVISSLWVGLLTEKYHKITVSTAGDYNFSFIRPDSPGQMVDSDGLLVPPNKTALSAWEDPTFIKKVPWSPFKSIKDFKYFVQNTAKNAGIYFLYISRNHIIFFTIIYFIVISATLRLKYTEKPLLLFATTIIHPIGYLMLLAEDRYFWLDYIILYILSAYILEEILKKSKFTIIQKRLLSALTIMYIAILPILYINGTNNYRVHLKNIYQTSNKIKTIHDFTKANIASQADNWCDDLYLAYYLKSKYYGKIRQDISDQKLKEKLIKFNIQYFFVHGKLHNHIDILKPYKKIDDITIYKVVPPEDISAG